MIPRSFSSKKICLVKNGLLAAYPTTESEGAVGMNRYSRDTTAEASKLEIGMRTHPLPLRLY